MKTTKITTAELTAQLIAMTDEKTLKAYVFQHLAGDENRFIRQEIIQELTGEKHYLVKCGVSYVIKHVQAFQTTPQNDMDVALAKAEPSQKETDFPLSTETAENQKLPAYEIEVGTPVIRKKCKRKGIIKANANGKMEIELEDGSIRKPATGRFHSLYNFANN